jgi:hypothetical protein
VISATGPAVWLSDEPYKKLKKKKKKKNDKEQGRH